ncbi:hypothetical protein JNUCC0626_32885 [Lentzea sp. JNUCC 0626]|uniref:hypothetical protein n=1 Tax=Lentzea sp. JNUCC 0626 TaxID=3367513 RepID=UPI00374A35C9
MDDLDDELRKLFSDDRLDVHSAPITTEAVVAGATRRRRRRAAVTGAFAVVAVVGAATGLIGLHAARQDETIGALLTTSSTAATTTPPPVSAGSATSAASSTATAGVPSNGSGAPNPNTKQGGTTTTKPLPNSSVPPKAEAQVGQLGSLALGMSEADALATGALIEPGSPADAENRCKNYATRSNPADNAIVVSPVRGIVRITLPDAVKTPKNVGKGSKVADVKVAYANAVQTATRTTAKMAATPPWTYVFETSGDTVTQVFMRLDANDCTSV